MRISDWSSDVCSSDLAAAVAGDRRLRKARQVGVAQGDRLLHRLRDPGKAGAQHQRNLGRLWNLPAADGRSGDSRLEHRPSPVLLPGVAIWSDPKASSRSPPRVTLTRDPKSVV